jgi:hypothetical protein
VFTDIGIFVEGWIAEMIAPTYDAELEKTHAYALFILLIPGLLLLFFNLVPFFKRGMEFQVHPDGSVSVRSGDDWALVDLGFDVDSESVSRSSFTATRK